MRLLVPPFEVLLPLALGGLAPLVLGAVYLPLSARRQRRIATLLTLRSVLLLALGFAALSAVAAVSVVGAGIRELHDRHAANARSLGDAIAQVPLSPVSGAAQLTLALFRAKDPHVSFVAVGADRCVTSCLVSVGAISGGAKSLAQRLRGVWPKSPEDERMLSLGDRAYLLVMATVFDPSGAPAAHGVAVVAGIDATSIVHQAARTAWTLLAISYALLVVVGWMIWRQVSLSLATRMSAITTQLRAGTAEDAAELLAADGQELRELADSVSMYIKRTLEQQELSDERHRRLVELSPDGVFICSAAGIRFANSAALTLAGARHRRELIGHPIERYLQFEKNAFRRDLAVASMKPARWTRADGTVLYVQVAEIADTIGGDSVRQYVVRDVTHQQRREADLAHRADHDFLTGLVNRSRFVDRLTDLVQTHATNRRADVREAAVLFIDLDDFKPVNDQHGHAAGDAVLVAVSERLRESTRGTDVLARLGGDEFAVLLEVRDDDELRTVAQRVLRSLRQPVVFDGLSLTVGTSIGTASVRRDLSLEGKPPAGYSAQVARALLRRADVAMYSAKAAGGDRICEAADRSAEQSPGQSPGQTSEVSFPAVA